MTRRYGSWPRSAFTLIELLVVVAIIAILASLLLAGLSRAIDIAKSLKCKSNLRQMGIGLTLYVQEHAAYPMGEYDENTASVVRAKRGWRALLREFSGEPVHWRYNYGEVVFKKTGIFRCPGVRAEIRDPGNVLWIVSYKNDFFTEHYGYNEVGSVGPVYDGSDYGLRGDMAVKGTPTRPTPENAVRVPSDMMALGDGFFGMLLGESIVRSLHMGRDYFWTPQSVDETKLSRRRHNNRSNVVFCDGHVEGIKLDTLFKDTSARALRRWNRDNEPHPIPVTSQPRL